MRARTIARYTAVYAVLLTLSLLFLAPFAYMAGTSFKPYSEITSRPLHPIPLNPTLDNIRYLYEALPFWKQFANGVIVAGSLTVLSILLCSLVAYGFAKYEFRFRNGLFLLVLVTMLIPPQVTLVPSFILFREFGWLDTFLPLILPWSVNAFGVFLIRQVMLGIPRELFDSARVDGSSELGTFFRIAMPLSASGVGILAVLSFMNAWNDYLGPLIYLTSREKMTLAVGITTMSNPYTADLAAPITGAFIMAIPVLILLAFVGQRYFVEGLTAGAVKG